MKTSSLFSASPLLFVSCEKEEEMEDDQPDVQHVSVIADTEKWESVAFSETIFSGTFVCNFESEITYFDGGIENGFPTFRSKHEWRTKGSNWTADKFHTVAGNPNHSHHVFANYVVESSAPIAMSSGGTNTLTMIQFIPQNILVGSFNMTFREGTESQGSFNLNLNGC